MCWRVPEKGGLVIDRPNLVTARAAVEPPSAPLLNVSHGHAAGRSYSALAALHGRRDRALSRQGYNLGEWPVRTTPPARERGDQARDRHHRMAIERSKVKITDELTGRALI